MRLRWAGPAVLATAAACGQAAAVFLDLPEGNEPVPTTAVAAPIAVQDTIRPPIEALANEDSILAQLPRDAGGYIDWQRAVSEGTIKPRRSIEPDPTSSAVSGFAFDFRFKGPNPMFDAEFPHSTHADWLTCQTCHPGIFPYRNQAITMADISAGEACGVCHGTPAFPATACYRCHPSLPASGTATPSLAADVVMARKADTTEIGTAGATTFPPAQFSHAVHRIRYRCSACHLELFDTKAASDTLTMEMLNTGNWCGACHGNGLAFDLLQCQRCHPRPEQGEGPSP